MVTMDRVPTWREMIAYKLANKRSKPSIAINWSSAISATVRVMLHLCGFGLLTFAGFTVNMLAGSVVAGVSCFVLSWLLTPAAATHSDNLPADPMLRR